MTNHTFVEMLGLEMKKYDCLIWLGPPAMLLAGVLAFPFGDMISICLFFGRKAYFEDGLRIVSHKPTTLSSGVVLSNNRDFVNYVIDLILWMGLTILIMWALVGLFAIAKRIVRRGGNLASKR